MQQYILIIPSKVTTIGHSCFRKSGIEELIILPDSKLTNIPDYAFYECEQLKSTKMLDGSKVVNIGYQAFTGCRQLYNLKLPNLLNSIGDGAFAGCCNLLIATLPENLQFIGDCCFKTNTSATDIYISSSLTKPPLFTKNGKVDSTSNPFGNILELTPKNVPTIIIPSSIVNTYRRTPHWIKYNGKITVKSDNGNYYTNLTYVNAGCPENVEYSISVNDLNIASVNSSSSKGKIIEQTYGVNIANIEVVVTSNTSGEERLLRVKWNGENGTIIYTPEDGIVQIPNESHEKNVSILLKRNVNVNCRGQLIIEIL
jgi:ribosomal protein L24